VARRRNPLSRVGTDFEVVAVLAVVGVGGYLLYKAVQGVTAAVGAVGSAAASVGKAVYSGAQTVTAPVSNFVAKVIYTPGPPMNVPGNVIFPDGTSAPVSSYSVINGSDGGVYIKDRGSTWRLGQSDPDGDWPATYVSG
jgi:hypothetical protein